MVGQIEFFSLGWGSSKEEEKIWIQTSFMDVFNFIKKNNDFFTTFLYTHGKNFSFILIDKTSYC